MKNRITYTISLLYFLFIAGCGTLTVIHRPNTTFSPDSRITVISDGTDRLDVKGKLEHLLLAHGFNVVSELTGSDKLKYESEMKTGAYIDNKTEASVQKSEASIGRVRECRSNYILRFNYKIDLGLLVAAFSASLIDLDTGDIIVSANLSPGSKRIDLVLEEFVNQLKYLKTGKK